MKDRDRDDPAPLVIGLLVAAFVVLMSGLKTGTSEPTALEHEHAPEKADEPPAQHQRDGGEIPPEPRDGEQHDCDAAEEKHRATEEKFWRYQFRVSFGGLVLSALAGLVALFGYLALLDQLSEAKKATAEAHNATIEARRQADAASTPYVFGDFHNAQSVHQWVIGRGTMQAQLAITNYGAGPAIVTDIECAAVVSTKNRVDFTLMDGPYHERSTFNFAPRTVVAKDHLLVAQCVDGWPRNQSEFGIQPSWGARELIPFLFQHAIWYLARITYEDISGKVSTSLLCVRYEDIGGARNEDVLGFIPFRAPECADHSQ